MTKGKESTAVKVTWAQTFRDITIRGMDKGQLLPLCLFIIAILLIWKLDSQQAENILFSFFDGLKNTTLLGWLLFIVTIILWAIHAKKMRRQFSNEIKRLGIEKTKLQQSKTKHRLGTSNNRGNK